MQAFLTSLLDEVIPSVITSIRAYLDSKAVISVLFAINYLKTNSHISVLESLNLFPRNAKAPAEYGALITFIIFFRTSTDFEVQSSFIS